MSHIGQEMVQRLKKASQGKGLKMRLNNVQKQQITRAIWQFGDAVKKADYDPNHNDATDGINLPPDAVATVEEAIRAAVEES